MPTVQKTISKFDLSSTDKGTWSTTGSQVWELGLMSSGVLAGSTINSATLDIYVDVTKSASTGILYLGTSTTGNSRNIGITNARSATYDITSIFSGITMAAEYDVLTFTYNVQPGVGNGVAHIQGYTNRATLVLTVTYTLPYTSCTPPSSVTSASTNVAPGATVRVSWSGASAGTNNPIASYTVYRSTDQTNWSTLQSGVTNAYLDVTAPTTNNATYYYRVKTIGSVSGYDSAESTSVASITCSYSAPSVSGVKIDGSTSTVYKLGGSTATLSWTGTNGTNNTISRYIIKQGSTTLADNVTGTSYTVNVPAAGAQTTFTVTPVGAYSNGSAVMSPTLAGYSATSAPTTVSVSKTPAGKSENITLSWSGAAAGTSNAITGYIIYRSTSASGTYSQLTTVSSTSTSGAVTVTSHATNGSYYYYKVATVGAHSTSAQSSYTYVRTLWTAPTTSAISLSVDTVAPSATSTLNFIVAAGTNNPVASIEVYQGDTKIATLAATATSYTVTAGSTAGDEVIFKVKPIGTETTPDSSLSTGVTLKSYGPVTAPSSVSVANATPDAGTTTTLSWSGASGGSFNSIVSYQVYRSTSASGTYTLLSTVTGTSLTVTAPSTMGQSYYYKVKTVGQMTTSDFSSAASVTAKTYTVPAAPVISVSPTSATTYESNPVLSWSAASGGTNNPVTGYRVYRSTTIDGTYTQLGSDLSSDTLSLSVSVNPTDGSSYFYKVYTLGTKAGYNVSAASNVVQLITSSVVKCGIPPNFRASQTLVNAGEDFNLLWGASTPGANNSVDHYEVWKYAGSGWNLRATVEPSSSNVYAEWAGAVGTIVRYRVRAISAVSSTFDSDYTEIVTVVTNSPPSKIRRMMMPSLKIYETTPITVMWVAATDPDNNIDYYEVQMRTRDSSSDEWGEWAAYANVEGLGVSAAPNLPRGGQFRLRIRTVDTLGLTSDWTETSSFEKDTIPNTPVIAMPSDNAVTYDAMPFIIVNADLLPTLNQKLLFMSIGTDEWHQMTPTKIATGVYSVRCYEALPVGELSIVNLRVVDSLGVPSETASVHIRRNVIAWERTISRGTIISKAGSLFFDDDLNIAIGSYDDEVLTVDNGSWNDDRLIVGGEGGISHQEEIAQMYMYVNTGLSYYNLPTITVPAAVGDNYSNAYEGKIGMFAAWGDQMLALYNALKVIYQRIGLTAPSVNITSGMMPTASIINVLRTMIENM